MTAIFLFACKNIIYTLQFSNNNILHYILGLIKHFDLHIKERTRAKIGQNVNGFYILFYSFIVYASRGE